ncbi:MAG: hypothetical protein HOQ05_07730 [Corynebacteriales bacterium]|nr:hypothetical protein [Mycobacteriales bacterium]
MGSFFGVPIVYLSPTIALIVFGVVGVIFFVLPITNGAFIERYYEDRLGDD